MTTSLSTATEPTPASGFADLHLSEPVLRALDEIGYSDPTPVQSATYPVAIAGRDVIVQARTGTGKTAAFGIPLVDRLVSPEPYVQALVLAPTRELAVQSQREIARIAQYKGLHTVAIYGGAPMGRQIEELHSGAQIVSGTPGRVLDHLRRGTLEPSRLKVLVLDEMDEMLSMGFAKELNAILELIPERGRRQTMCFSATVDGEVRRHAERHMQDPEMISLSSDAVAAEQISHQVYMVTGRDRVSDLVHVLEVEDPESAIVFCNMRSETERVATGLKQAGFNADWLNGDLPQRDRERIMASTREGRLRYLVATDVAARGIDISHLTHVINFTFPESAAVYVHRTGRTGRAGRTGSAVSLVGPEELGRLYYLRLEYKISPIERSLPTSGERKTRQEIDRIGLLESAVVAPPSASDLAVARRLLTHPDGERILAGLLHTFFGTRQDPDEEAAAARRSKLRESGEVLPDTSADAGWRGEGRDRGRGRERDRDRPARPGRPREREAQERSGPNNRERDTQERDRRRGLRDATASVPARPERERPERERPEQRDRDRQDSARPERAGARLERVRPESRDRQDGVRAEQAPAEASSERPRRERPRWPGARPQDATSEDATVPPVTAGRDAAEAGAVPDRSEETTPIFAQAQQQADLGAPDLEPTRELEAPPPRRREPRRARARSSAPPAPGNATTPATDGALLVGEPAEPDEENPGEAAAHLEGLLYLNLGKRDGVRVGEVARLLRDSCELSRSEIGRIRVRDRYTFVDVPEERLDTIISTLSGQVVHDKALAPERAKTAKT